MQDIVFKEAYMTTRSQEAKAVNDKKSFEDIYDEYKNQVYRAVLNYTGDKNIAADLYQEIFLRIYKNYSSKYTTENGRSWIARITHNVIIDNWRRKKRWQKIFISGEEKINSAVAREEIPEISDNKIKIQNAICGLPEAQKEVVIMYYDLDLSFREIAEILDLSINTISSRARYGLIKLKKVLGEENEL